MEASALRVLVPALALALLAAGCVQRTDPAATTTPGSTAAPGALVVLAHIDTGINPYHATFRDDGPLAQVHPSTYLPGFPADAPALVLTLDAPDFETAYAADAEVWAAVERDTLYWIPGTRIVGAISFGAGGTNCPPSEQPPLSYVSGDCEERILLDDHGHGTMTASRAAAAMNSLAPTARIVTVEGAGAAVVEWVAEQGWIDVQTNSWLDLVPPPASAHVDGISTAFGNAAQKMVTIAASGNGAAYLLGFAPTPTYVLDTAAPGVILVGAHDNGHLAPWSGAPAHVVADGFGGWTARIDSLDLFEPHGLACCTSAAAPYAAGGAAALVLEARRLLGDTTPGVADGVLAQGTPLAAGPLADGDLTVAELRALLLATATARPAEGPDDGLVHWGARGAPDDPTQPSGNPYCLGCWSAPLRFDQVPEGAPLVAHAGYGSVDPTSVALAVAVLRGEAEMPARPTEDAFFAADAAVRALVFGL